MVELFFIAIQLLFLVYLVFYIVAFLSGAPYVPTTKRTAESMIHLARLQAHETAIDLGSGDGTLLLLIARTGAKAIGVEINPLLVFLSRIRSKFYPFATKITVIQGDFWHTDINHADVLFVYLLPNKMGRLEEKIRKEAKSGTRIVSNSFIFPHLTLIDKDPKNHVYVYRI